MNASYLSDSHFSELSIEHLPTYFKEHGLQRIYTAKNPAWNFDILNNEWQLGTKFILRLEKMKELDIPLQAWVALRILLANSAENLGVLTVQHHKDSFFKVGNGWRNGLGFQAVFHTLHDGHKSRLMSTFRSLEKTALPELLPIKSYFDEIIRFLNTQEYPNPKPLKGVFDPEKGVYTDEEMSEIQNKLRLQVSDILSKLNKDVVPSFGIFFEFSNIICLLLLITIYRRPVQLAMIKWSDLLPVGVSFKDHRYAGKSPLPEDETKFTDIAQLHLRTFKAKRGFGFRDSAEKRSHRLEPEFSNLIGVYRYFYEKLLVARLNSQGIHLSKDELEDILYRCPLFPSRDLFVTQYNSKRNLFSLLGHQSDVMHLASNLLMASLKRCSKRLKLSSTRIDSFNISNNRSRHTVITNAVERGLSAAQAAAITGVTSNVIKEYMQLDMRGRVAINEVLAGQRVIKQFARMSLTELKSLDGFVVKNEFDEVQGALKSSAACHNCKASICKPIGCYGCDNFRPFWDADHESNLSMIEEKIAFNQKSSPDKQTLRKLQVSRLYCKATIDIITETKLNEGGLIHVD